MRALLIVAAIVIAIFLARRDLVNRTNLVEEGLLPLKAQVISGPAVGSGSPMLLECWATWCGPCRQSIPHLNELQSKFASQGLKIVGITREDAATVSRFMQQMPMRYTVAIDPEGVYSQRLGVRGIPHAFLVDRDGKVVWDGHPMELNASIIQSVL